MDSLLGRCQCDRSVFSLQCDAGIHNYRYDRVRYDDIKVTKKHCMKCGEVSFENPTVRG